MALFKSTLLAQISGSVDGTTFSHNAGGTYMRARSTPVDPASAPQQQIRSDMSAAAAHWKELSQSIRDDWDDYAKGTPVLNRVGDAIYLTGLQWYVAAVVFRSRITGAPVLALAAPTILGQPPLPITDVTLNVDGDLVITMPAVTGSESRTLAAFISAPQSEASNFFKGPFLFGGTAALTSATLSSTIAIGSQAPNGGSWVEGQKRFVRLRVLDSENRLSAETIRPVTLEAA